MPGSTRFRRVKVPLGPRPRVDIQQVGVMPHWPKCRQAWQMPKRARRRKLDTAKAELEPPTDTLEGRAPTARWGLKGMRRTTGS